MQWNSWSDFWAMGGHGFYVWGSYGLSVLVLAGEVWLLRRRRREVLQDLRDRAHGGEEKTS